MSRMTRKDPSMPQCCYCRNTSDLYKSLDKCKVGDVLDLEVLRQTGDKGKEHVSVTLESG